MKFKMVILLLSSIVITELVLKITELVQFGLNFSLDFTSHKSLGMGEHLSQGDHCSVQILNESEALGPVRNSWDISGENISV